jgi:hypothetical protein
MTDLIDNFSILFSIQCIVFALLCISNFCLKESIGVSSAGEVMWVIIGNIMHDLMSLMKTCVSSVDIIRRITQSYSSGTKFSEFKDVIFSMLSTYNHEAFVTATVLRVHLGDLHRLKKHESLLKVGAG